MGRFPPGQRENLVHHLDPDVLRIARRIEDDGPGIEDDLSLGGGMEAGQDLHQGRLARPVVPDDPQCLARKEAKVDTSGRGDRTESLGNAARLEQRRGRPAVSRATHLSARLPFGAASGGRAHRPMRDATGCGPLRRWIPLAKGAGFRNAPMSPKPVIRSRFPSRAEPASGSHAAPGVSNRGGAPGPGRIRGTSRRPFRS